MTFLLVVPESSRPYGCIKARTGPGAKAGIASKDGRQWERSGLRVPTRLALFLTVTEIRQSVGA